MNAFTITTDHQEWDALSSECARRLAAYGDTKLRIITARDEFDSHLQKLLVPLLRTEPIWFFDSDWWMLKEAALPEIPRGHIIATHCRSGHERYCNSAADLARVFGTTLYGADAKDDKVRAAFTKAIHLQSEFYWNGKPKADESFLNIACQQLGVPVIVMEPRWNHCATPDADTIGLHAGGRWPKLDWMRETAGAIH